MTNFYRIKGSVILSAANVAIVQSFWNTLVSNLSDYKIIGRTGEITKLQIYDLDVDENFTLRKEITNTVLTQDDPIGVQTNIIVQGNAQLPLNRKVKVRQLWDEIKSQVGNYLELTFNGTTFTIHICPHDDIDPVPCDMIKQLATNTILKDDAL